MSIWGVQEKKRKKKKSENERKEKRKRKENGRKSENESEGENEPQNLLHVVHVDCMAEHHFEKMKKKERENGPIFWHL